MARGRKTRKDRGKGRRPAQQAAGGKPARRMALAVIALCGIHFLLAVTSVLGKSNTYDELAHLTRGYSYRLTGDFRLGPPHPPLAHYWASLPGGTAAVRMPPLDDRAGRPLWQTSDVWKLGQQFFYYHNRGNAAQIDTLLWRGRAMIALLSTALCLLVFLWSRRLFGTVGAFISLTLCALSPTVLAHGRLVTTDCIVTLLFMASLAAVWWLLQRVSWGSILAGAAALSGLMLAKMSALLIIPVGLVLMIVRVLRGGPLPVRLGPFRRDLHRRISMVGVFLAVMVIWVLVAWGALWAGYGFRYAAMRQVTVDDTGAEVDRFYSPNGVPKGRELWDYQLRRIDHIEPFITFLRDHRLLPEAYIYNGVFARQTARGRMAFLNGRRDKFGFRAFFPYAFLVKTPLPLLALLVIAAVAPWRRRALESGAETTSPPPRFGTRLYELSPLLVFLVVYWAASLNSRLNIGHRHILPTYPVLFILCGSLGPLWSGGSAWLRRSVRGLVALFVLASLATWPNYLAYFNLLAGGPGHAWKHLVDSSLDWGQDLPALGRVLAARTAEGETGPVYLSYFGSGSTPAVDHFDITARRLPMRASDTGQSDFNYRPGLYAISATHLQQVYNDLTIHTWDAEREEEYRALQTRFTSLENLTEPRRDAAALNRFCKLRFLRLCTYLRTRGPDNHVNHSILLFELSSKDLDAALDGPMAGAPG